jgi:hypothetical protein
MKKEQLQELLTNAGVELNDNIKLDEIHNGVNDFATNLTKTKVDEALQNIDKKQYVDEFLKEKGYENEQAFETFVNTTRENLTDLDKLKLDFEEKLKGYESKIEDLSQYQAKASELEIDNKFISAGVKDLEFAKFKYSQNKEKENFDFDKFIEEDLKVNNAYIFGEEQVKDNGIGKITPPQGSNIDDLASRMGLSESDLK